MPKKTLKYRKIGDREYEVMVNGVSVAVAAQTGEHGRDHYPWDWYLLPDVRPVPRPSNPSRTMPNTGAEGSRKACAGQVLLALGENYLDYY